MATSTTSTINDVVNTEVIEPVALDYAYDYQVIDQLVAPFSTVGRSSATLQLWKLASNLGSVGAYGAGYDTEFDVATQATDISSTTLSTDPVTISATEYGLNRTISDAVFEDAISGTELTQMVLSDSARILMAAWESDLSALLSALNGGTPVGSSGSDLTLAQMSSAVITLRNKGVRAPDGFSFVLDLEQANNYETALVAVGTSMAVYAGAADRLLAATPTATSGLANGQIGWFRNARVFATSTKTANTAADVVGALLVHDSPGNRPYAALGKNEKRPFRVLTQRDESLRATEFIASMRMGCGELSDASGIPIVTDAP